MVLPMVPMLLPMVPMVLPMFSNVVLFFCGLRAQSFEALLGPCLTFAPAFRRVVTVTSPPSTAGPRSRRCVGFLRCSFKI